MVDGLIYVATVSKPDGKLDKVDRLELITTFRNKGHIAVLPPEGGEHTIVVPEGEEFAVRVCVVTNTGEFNDGEEHKLTLTRENKSVDVHKDDPACVGCLRLSQIMMDYFEDLPTVAVANQIADAIIANPEVLTDLQTRLETETPVPLDVAPIVNPEIPADPIVVDSQEVEQKFNLPPGSLVDPQPEPAPAPIVNPEIPVEPAPAVDNPTNPVE